MNSKDLIGDLNSIFNEGPQSIGNKAVTTYSDCKFWIKKHYHEENMKIPEYSDVDDWLCFNRPRFYVGKIYTFQYIDTIRDQFDTYPIFLSIGSKLESPGKMVEMGINLNKIPLLWRASFLSAITKTFNREIDHNINKLDRKERDQIDLPIEYPDKFRFFCKNVVKMNLSKCVELYNKEKINRINVKVIKYEDWKYLLHYVPDTIINTSVGNMWNDFVNNQNQTR